jgi:hypothetical protein
MATVDPVMTKAAVEPAADKKDISIDGGCLFNALL